MTRTRLVSAAAIWALVLVPSGCATKIYQGPTSGRSAEAQQAVSAGADRALRDFDAAKLKGQTVCLRVYGLTPKLEGESPEEGLVRGLLYEKLTAAGVRVVESAKDAQVLLIAALKTAGVDIIRRDVPIIYHHTTFRGLFHVRLTAMRLEGGAAVRVLHHEERQAEAIYRETYIFYIIGPLTTRTVETVPGFVE